MFVKCVGRLRPRDAVLFFEEHPDIWDNLKNGKEIEIPDEIFGSLAGVEQVEKTERKSRKKMEVGDIDGILNAE